MPGRPFSYGAPRRNGTPPRRRAIDEALTASSLLMPSGVARSWSSAGRRFSADHQQRPDEPSALRTTAPGPSSFAAALTSMCSSAPTAAGACGSWPPSCFRAPSAESSVVLAFAQSPSSSRLPGHLCLPAYEPIGLRPRAEFRGTNLLRRQGREPERAFMVTSLRAFHSYGSLTGTRHISGNILGLRPKARRPGSSS